MDLAALAKTIVAADGAVVPIPPGADLTELERLVAAELDRDDLPEPDRTPERPRSERWDAARRAWIDAYAAGAVRYEHARTVVQAIDRLELARLEAAERERDAVTARLAAKVERRRPDLALALRSFLPAPPRRRGRVLLPPLE